MDHFVTTRWTLILEAADAVTPAGRAALASLCERYWMPVFAYLRRCGYTVDDAKDLTQGFFVHVLEKHAIRRADPARGRFRSFLLASLNHYVAHERERQEAHKRGGRATVLHIDDWDTIADRFELHNADTPDRLFERQWALTLLDRAVRRVREDYESTGKTVLFEHLKSTLTGDDLVSYEHVAFALGMTEGAVRVAVHRLRARYRDAVRGEIADTVSSADHIDGEIAYLLAAVSA